MGKLNQLIIHSGFFAPLRYLKIMTGDAKEISDTEKKYGDSDSFSIRSKIAWNSAKYKISFDEYYLFDFASQSDNQKKDYIGEKDLTGYIRKFNSPKMAYIFNDKYETYRHFERYFKRSACKVSSEDDFEEFDKLVTLCRRVIVKPVSSSCGNGVAIFNLADFTDAKTMFDILIGQYESFVAEELIRQSDEMARFNLSSVNTVRTITVLLRDKITIWLPFFRVGRAGSVVDNGGAGGILCALNGETGEITACRDELNNNYTVHPDSGEKLVGEKIPKWDEALEISRELAGIIPENRFTGWDLALTNDGWVLVEANTYPQFVCQQMFNGGCRKDIEGFINEL